MERMYLSRPPQRVVSLVPSITESLFDLGFGDSVVGITDFCNHPAEKLVHLARIGGPKTPNFLSILDLQPELVFVNQEENVPDIVNDLNKAGIPVWIFFPKTVHEAIADLWDLTGLYHSEEGGLKVHTIEMALDWMMALGQDLQPVPYFCPIWQEEGEHGRWWMTFSAHTYTSDLLRILKGKNIFDQRIRRYPLSADLGLEPEEDPAGRDVRYPRVTFDEIMDACPEVILLPDEPYLYSENDRQKFFELFSETPAASNGHIYLVDGSLLTWPGTRLARSLSELSGIFEIQ
jgi:iron complex transport system substrate-binding protein